MILYTAALQVPSRTMHVLRSILSTSTILVLLLTMSPVEAAFLQSNEGSSLTPRGFRRSISRKRDRLQHQCKGIEDETEKRRCFLRQLREGREAPLNAKFYQREESLQHMGQRCGHLVNVGDWRACAKGDRTGVINKENQRIFYKRTSRRQRKQGIEECREKETGQEQLKCLQAQGTKRRSKIKLNRRNRLEEKAPIDFISPYGLRRNLSRTRDIINEECGEIRDGQEKRSCLKRVRKQYEGY